MRNLKWHAYPTPGGHVIVVRINDWTGACCGVPEGKDPWPMIQALTDEVKCMVGSSA